MYNLPLGSSLKARYNGKSRKILNCLGVRNMTIKAVNIIRNTTIKRLVFIFMVSIFTILNLFSFGPRLAKALSYSVLRELAKQQFMYKTKHLAQLEGEHFIIRYYPKDENVAKMVLQNAEDIYKPVGDKLQFTSKGKVPVVIYPTREALGQSFGWEANESAMGVYWAGAIRILSPNEWIYEENPEKLRQVFKKKGPMAHEFTHLVVDYYTRGNYTRWLTEGIAQHIEYKLTGFKFDGKESSLKQPLYSFDSMDKQFDALQNQGLAYRQSLVAVEYLIERFGEDKLKELLDNLRKGENLDKSMQNALGIDLFHFESDFKNWVKLNLDLIEAKN